MDPSVTSSRALPPAFAGESARTHRAGSSTADRGGSAPQLANFIVQDATFLQTAAGLPAPYARRSL